MQLLTNEERSVVRGAGWYAFKWIAVIVIVMSAIGWASWGLGVFTSDIKGRGEAIKTKNSSTNRIAAQERFEDRYSDIQASAQRIAAMQAAAKAAPDDYTARVQATGALTYCQQAVADYNADARKYTAAQFRASDLPASIDATTTCTGATS